MIFQFSTMFNSQSRGLTTTSVQTFQTRLDSLPSGGSTPGGGARPLRGETASLLGVRPLTVGLYPCTPPGEALSCRRPAPRAPQRACKGKMPKHAALDRTGCATRRRRDQWVALIGFNRPRQRKLAVRRPAGRPTWRGGRTTTRQAGAGPGATDRSSARKQRAHAMLSEGRS